jgi:Membrane-bound lysozyme-inhibitor of c-type lysozyme
MHSQYRCAFVLVSLTLLAADALARPSTYKCAEDVEFKVDFTPRKAQLYLADKTHALVRIKSANDAHYVNRNSGITLIAKKSDLTLREGGRELQCKLQITP